MAKIKQLGVLSFAKFQAVLIAHVVRPTISASIGFVAGIIVALLYNTFNKF